MERTAEVESAARAPIEESGNEAEEACKVDENPFKCDKCESIFKNIRGLKTHQGRAHKIIPQVDGPGEELEDDCIYTFVSNYGREDIDYTLVEVLSDEIECELISREKVGHDRSADHLCTIRVIKSIDDWQWPGMNGLQNDVIKNLKRVSSCC